MNRFTCVAVVLLCAIARVYWHSDHVHALIAILPAGGLVVSWLLGLLVELLDHLFRNLEE
jgi:hypothetical protein